MDTMSAFKEMLPYVREFQGKLFVVKVGGEVCEPDRLDEIARQLSLIHHIGMNVVLVHGGGPQMNSMLETLGVERKMIAGRRITDDTTLEVAKMVYKGLVGTNIVSALARQGARAVGLSGVDAGIIRASKRPKQLLEDDSGKVVEVDFGHVGDITEIDPSVLHALIEKRIIPVVCALGGGANGEVFNINADTISSRIAQTLKAEKYIVLTNVAGVLEDVSNPQSLVSYADVDTLSVLIEKGAIKGGMRPKVEACIDAIRNGVHRTHIIDGTRDEALLIELFKNEGCGTMIVDRKEKLSQDAIQGGKK
ncbi:MAG: acetylglutamate kinase [Bdellovibrionales bacterium]|nr:acetylglutamate kinase [Bdellovibrionales bacterium]